MTVLNQTLMLGDTQRQYEMSPYRVFVMVPELWVSGSGHGTELSSSSLQVNNPLQSCNKYKLHLGWRSYTFTKYP